MWGGQGQTLSTLKKGAFFYTLEPDVPIFHKNIIENELWNISNLTKCLGSKKNAHLSSTT